MRQFASFLSATTILLAGCASTPPVDTEAKPPAEEVGILLRLDEVFDAVQSKNLERLDEYHLYGPKFTKFDVQPAGRQDSEEARRLEHAGLESATEPWMAASDLKIDVFGDVGIATFFVDYGSGVGADKVQGRARATMVFVRENESWRIVHEHFSSADPNP